MNKNIKNILYTGCLALVLTTSLSSCEDYLDKSPETTVSSEDAFKTFKNFQGFIEEIYNWCPSWNWGDDEVFNSKADAEMTHQMDLGNYRDIYTNGYASWFYRAGSDPKKVDAKSHSIYPHAWYCIRKCNLGLANLDKLTTATHIKNVQLRQERTSARLPTCCLSIGIRPQLVSRPLVITNFASTRSWHWAILARTISGQPVL